VAPQAEPQEPAPEDAGQLAAPAQGRERELTERELTEPAGPAQDDQPVAGEARASDPAGRPGRRDALRRQRQHVSLPAVSENKGRLRRRAGELVRNMEQRARVSQRRRDRAGVYAFLVARQVGRRWLRDRCFEKAAALAFHTVLSLVPLLAMAVVVLRWSGSMNAESLFVDFVSRELIPVSREVIAENLTTWSDNINLETLGIGGLIAALLFSFMMVNTMEDTVNIIWRSEKRRSMAQKFVVFYASATIGPFLVGTSLFQAAKYGLTEGHSGLLLSVLTSYGALFLANFFLPANKVKVSSAALGALISMLLFELARFGFQLYVTNFAFASYSGIYGTLAVLPLLFVWIFYTWLTFLFGVEVAHVAQNFNLLQVRDRRRPLSLENELLQRVNGVVAARVMLAVSSAYIHGDKVMPRRALEDMFDLSHDVLSRIAERLKRHDLLIEVEGQQHGFLPGRPPSEISLGQVLAAFRGDDITATGEHPRSPLDRVLSDIERTVHERTDALSMADLVDDQRPARAP
jgi:membrane protein